MAKEGVAILMISSELPELMAMSDRFVVMAEGRVVGELSSEDATETKVMEMATTTFKTVS
jgi:ABC-type sugar transport system ATPase subunit